MSKEYSGESIIDAEQDISDALADADDIPSDQGIPNGTFKIVMTWVPDEETYE